MDDLGIPPLMETPIYPDIAIHVISFETMRKATTGP